MKVRFQADADLNQIIVSAVVRRVMEAVSRSLAQEQQRIEDETNSLLPRSVVVYQQTVIRLMDSH